MLEIMRSHKFFSVFLLTAITVMIIITFVFWGIGPNTTPSAGFVAQVEDEKITLDEYWRAYDNEYRRLRDTYSEEEIKKLDIKNRVLEALIDRKVLIIAARKAGMVVTKEELREVIASNPYFQRDGVFDPNVYTKALKLNRMTPKTFEEGLKEDILFQRMSRLIGETAELTPGERKILESIKGDSDQLTQLFLATKADLTIKAYVEGLKQTMRIRINENIIS
jgi:peptidyl-prolyl cis-trans isomerase D